MLSHDDNSELSRDQLLAQLRAFRAVDAERERLLHELEAHQVELETQNTELREAKVALTASRDRYAHLYDHAPVGYVTLDRSGIIREVNLTATKLLNTSLHALIGQSLTAWLAPESVRPANAALMRLGRGEQPVWPDLALINDRWIRVRSRAGADAIGDDPGLHLALLDTTEQHSADLALRASETRFRFLFEHSPEGIFVADPTGHYTDVNHAGAAMLGYSREEILDRTIHDIVVAEEVTRIPVELASLAGGNAMTSEWRFLRKEGSVFTGEVVAHQLPDGSLQAIVRDITARKEAEEALLALTQSLERKVAERTEQLEAERNFIAAVLDSQAALMIVLDAQGRVVRFNRACEATAGYDLAALGGISSRWEQLVPEDERAGVRDEVLVPLHAGADYVEHENHWICKDGTRRLINWRNKPLKDEQGVLRFIIGTGIDITDLHQAEEAAREHLEEASRLQRLQTANELATVLAHEVNQPLAAIATYAEVGLQLLRKPAPQPDRLAANLERISRQALRAGDIIRHLRRFVSRGHIDPVSMDLNAVVRSACDLMAPQAHKRRIRLETKLNHERVAVMGVDVQVEQVLLNLLGNACDAIQDADTGEGTVTVSTHRAGNKVQVTVSDSGPGIDADAAATLFEPLSSRKAQGLGVGLRISRSLIEAHGGRLWVEPQVPGGVFHFELPLAP